MLKRALLSVSFVALLVVLQPQRVEAAVISVGPYTVPANHDPFLVPIQITGGVNVTAWSFSLTYDPTDLIINDPAMLDFLGRPVTEGNFFAAGAPFNLLIPGVIELSGSFNQTGNLFGVEGAYGGFRPLPSGDGVLAYIEFTRAPNGDGDTPITVTDPSITSAVVPEPTTVALLAVGLFTIGARRRLPLPIGAQPDCSRQRTPSLKPSDRTATRAAPAVETAPERPTQTSATSAIRDSDRIHRPRLPLRRAKPRTAMRAGMLWRRGRNIRGRTQERLQSPGGGDMTKLTKNLLALWAIGMGIAISTPALAVDAVGPYYATPSWDQTLPAGTRFIVLTNMKSEAVLDRETGLVWEQSPSKDLGNYPSAMMHCINLLRGGRMGWRLPTIQELLSLMDRTGTVPFPGPTLPSGHPFDVPPFSVFWSASNWWANSDLAWIAIFAGIWSGDLGGPGDRAEKRTGALPVWCVRGGSGFDLKARGE